MDITLGKLIDAGQAMRALASGTPEDGALFVSLKRIVKAYNTEMEPVQEAVKGVKGAAVFDKLNEMRPVPVAWTVKPVKLSSLMKAKQDGTVNVPMSPMDSIALEGWAIEDDMTGGAE